jgi:hypothetical protein
MGVGCRRNGVSIKGEKVVVGFVVDGVSCKTLGFEALFEGGAFRRWLEPYAKALGTEVLLSDDNDSHSKAAAELGLSHQLCIAHVRKYVARRVNSIYGQAKREWKAVEEEKLEKLAEDLDVLKEVLNELSEEGGRRIGQLYREYYGLFAQEKIATDSGSFHIRTGRGYPHLGVVAEVEQDTVTAGTSLLGPRWHQERLRVLHRQEQGTLQEYARLKEPRRDGTRHRAHPRPTVYGTVTTLGCLVY